MQLGIQIRGSDGACREAKADGRIEQMVLSKTLVVTYSRIRAPEALMVEGDYQSSIQRIPAVE